MRSTIDVGYVVICGNKINIAITMRYMFVLINVLFIQNNFMFPPDASANSFHCLILAVFMGIKILKSIELQQFQP
uniref:Uncharacterized protein n=1 Tax=Glossina palpalis gambiensis TaxID=67801 RepID=A0A1B0AT36_9MUSC